MSGNCRSTQRCGEGRQQKARLIWHDVLHKMQELTASTAVSIQPRLLLTRCFQAEAAKKGPEEVKKLPNLRSELSTYYLDKSLPRVFLVDEARASPLAWGPL